MAVSNDDLAAYNWIVIDALCPACAQRASVRCQTHVASSYSGDASGRFHDREYRLGQTMAWFTVGHSQYDEWDWSLLNDPDDSTSGEEACCADCTGCGADLCVVIRFRGLVPEQVCAVSLEDNWPQGYPR